ncbi:MAG: hypothetical protein ABIG71_04895 [Candidatus Uhrbacteria bacterium]
MRLRIFVVIGVLFGVLCAGVFTPISGALAAGNEALLNAAAQFGTTMTNAGITQTRGVEYVVGGVIKAALSIIGVLFFVYMVYAGYLWLTAHGETEPITKAKKILSGAVIGLAITFAAYAITYFVVAALTEASGLK